MSPHLEELKRAIREFGHIYNVTETVGRVSIDFRTGEASQGDLLSRANDGEYGSAAVIDTSTDEVMAGTIRLGGLGLSDEADRFVAETKWQQAVEETDPPGDVNVRLRHNYGDILHVDTDKRIPIKEYTEWLPRVVQKADSERENIAEFAHDIGEDMDTDRTYRTRSGDRSLRR